MLKGPEPITIDPSITNTQRRVLESDVLEKSGPSAGSKICDRLICRSTSLCPVKNQPPNNGCVGRGEVNFIILHPCLHHHHLLAPMPVDLLRVETDRKDSGPSDREHHETLRPHHLASYFRILTRAWIWNAGEFLHELLDHHRSQIQQLMGSSDAPSF
jgi:hypothetical protein